MSRATAGARSTPPARSSRPGSWHPHAPGRRDRLEPNRLVVLLPRCHVRGHRQLRRHLRALKPEYRGYLAEMMESVVDIPKESINAGLPWDWETYGEYLESIDRMDKGVNVGGMVGHCAVRIHAMGERSLHETPATTAPPPRRPGGRARGLRGQVRHDVAQAAASRVAPPTSPRTGSSASCCAASGPCGAVSRGIRTHVSAPA